MSKVKQIFSNRSWKIIGALQVVALLLAIAIGSWSVAAAVVVIAIGLGGAYITGHPRLGKLLSPPVETKSVKISPLTDPRSQGIVKKPTGNVSRRAVLHTATLTSIAVAGAVVATPSSGLWTTTEGFYSGNLTRSIRNGNNGLGGTALETFIAESYDSLPGPFNPENHRTGVRPRVYRKSYL